MIKKGLILFIAFAMVLSYSVVVAPTTSAASDGDNIKMDGLTTVYYLNGGKRYVYPNGKTWFTWYPDFSNVITVSQSEIESYPLAGNVTYRPGTNMVKINTVPTVYAVEPGGTLRSIVSEANAADLYGSDWNTKIDDVPDAFFVNYTIGDDLTVGKYSTGTLVKETGAATTYYIDGDTKRPVATGEAFDANNFNWTFLQAYSDLSGYSDGTSITGAESDLTTVAGTAGDGDGAEAGSVSVALSASTPGAATIISDTEQTGQALVPMVTVNFTAPSEGDVTVTNLKYKRTGISADSDVDDLYLYDGMTRLYQGGSLSSNYASFNYSPGLFIVPAGTTKAVTLKIDLNQNTSAGKTMGFQLEEVTTKEDATVNGSLPLGGNLMTTASVADMGYVDTSFGNVPGSAQTVNPGEEDFEAYKLGINANSQDLQLEYLKLTLLGSINVDDLENIKLRVGGTVLATGTINTDRELVFDLTADPYIIEKGQNKILSVRADVVGGSTRTFRFSVEYSSDLIIKDRNYGVYIVPIDNGSATSSWSSLKSSASTYIYTVNEGSLAISLDSSSPTENVPASSTNIKLATFKFEATGEDVKVKTLNVSASTTLNSAGGLDNGKVLVDGLQVGSTTDLVEGTTGTQFSFGSSFIVPAGESVLVDVYSDIKNTDGTNYTTGTVRAELIAGSGNAQGQASLTSIDTSAQAGTALTVTAASLTIAKYQAYGNQNIVKPATQAKVGSFTIQAGAYEGITVDTINIDQATSGVMQNMKLIDHDSAVQYGATKVTLTSTDATDNVFSVSNMTLAKNESRVVDVYADVKSSTGMTTIDLDAGAIGTSDVTGTTKYHSGTGDADVNLQTITITTGAIYSAADGSKPDADIIVAGSSKVLMNAVKFTASNEAYTVSKVRIEQATAGASDHIGTVILEYPNEAGNTVTTTGYLDSNNRIDFTGLTMYVPKDQTAVMSIYADIPLLAVSQGDSGESPRLDFDSDNNFYALGAASNSADEDPDTDVAGNEMVVRKSKPIITLETLSSTVLAAGTGKDLIKFTITASGDAIYFKELNFSYSSSTNVAITASTVKLYKASDTSTALNTAATPDYPNKTVEIDLSSEQQISSSETYVLQADLTGTYTTGDFISTSLPVSATNATAGMNVDLEYLDNYETGAILWSDGSETNHTASSTDYCDATYVKTLPLAQTLTR